MDDLVRLDAVAQAELVRRGEISAIELTEAALARIEALEPELGAMVTVDADAALQRARQQPTGLLGGVPYAIKDLLGYPGLRHALGCRLFDRQIAGEHSPYTARLDAAGLVVVGKTATSELGLLGSTETLLEGITHNPWDRSRSAAGSSGGAAAAVAAGLFPVAHASDGGGSVRIPASVCGLFGLKPSRHRCVPALPGGDPAAELLSDHCVSRTVRDSAAILAATERSDGPHPPIGFVRDPLSQPLRIGWWTTTLLGARPAPECARVAEEAAALCTELGHQVAPLSPPQLDGGLLRDVFFEMAGLWLQGLIAQVEAATGAPLSTGSLEPFTLALAQHAATLSPRHLERLPRTMRELGQGYLEIFEQVDLVLTPTLATEPWAIGHLAPTLDRELLIERTSEAVGYTPIHNFAGCAAMSVPLGTSASGLPIGAHFAAPPGGDALLLGLAYQLEAARPWAARWPPHSVLHLGG